MKYAWMDKETYFADIEVVRKRIMQRSNAAKNEAQTAEAFQTELYYYIRNRMGVEVDFHQETPIGGGLSHSFGVLEKKNSRRGRLDAVIHNLVIEYKKRSKLEKESDQMKAIRQVTDYLELLYNNEHVRYNAILTDGIRICYFEFKKDKVEHTAFKPLEAKDIDRIVQAIVLNNSKQFVAENVLKDFAVDIQVDTVSKRLADELYHKLTDEATARTEMLFQEWESLMHLSCDDSGKSNDIAKRRRDLSLIFGEHIDEPDKEYRALFALQTAYAIIVKLIACKVVDKLEFQDTKTYSDLTKISSTDLQKFLEQVEDGYVYRSSNVVNFLEGDFFSWYSALEQWDEKLWRVIKEIIVCIDEYSAFSLDVSYEPVDIFKDLYMSMMPKSVRHSMGEYFTPEWLADYVITEGLRLQENENWKAIDPCCGSGTFVISLIKHIVGDVKLHELEDSEKEKIVKRILSSVYGIDINPLSVLSARVGYYLALKPFGNIKNVEIPIYLGDSAITPVKETIDQIECYKYSVVNKKKCLQVVLPVRFVKGEDFGKTMAMLQAAVKTERTEIVLQILCAKLNEEEKKSQKLLDLLKKLSGDLVELHQNSWDGIWVRIAMNFMRIARLGEFDLIVGNPPWVKWEHLPSKYAERIKELCDIKHIFSTRGRFGGTQLNICALISNVAAANWLKQSGVLAFLMPDSIMSQNSYEEFRLFYLDYETKERLYLQQIDKWEKPLRPFRCGDKAVSQDFITYYFSRKGVDYSKGIPVTVISRKAGISDNSINQSATFEEAEPSLTFDKGTAAQMSERSTAFSYLSDRYDFSKIIGRSDYEYRTGVEFTPQELYLLVGAGASDVPGHYLFENKKFKRSKYVVDDMPVGGWDLPADYIYPIVTGPSLTPFSRKIKNEYCVLPYDEQNTQTPVSVEDMLEKNPDLFHYLLNHQELIDSQSEKSKVLHRGDEFYALSKIGPYTFSQNIVAARDNTRFCACVIEPSETEWGEKKQSICVKHTMLIGRDLNGRELTKDEAHYICGILNSTIVIAYMHNTFKSNGYSLKKSHFYLPKFDQTNARHKKIAAFAKKSVCGE